MHAQAESHPGSAARLRAGVAMCVFNGARYLRAQLESIAAQTRLPSVMVVVDDGSTDGSWELLQDWAAKAPFPVRLQRNEANLGVVANFEKAVRLLLEEVDVIFFSDQDDVWFPGKAAAFLDAFAADPAVGLVHSDAELVDSEGLPLGRRLLHALLLREHERNDVAAGRAYRAYARRNLVTGAACACRSSVLAQALPFSPDWVHDEWIAFTASLVSRVVMLEHPWMAYRLHGANTVGLPVPSLAWRVRVAMRAFLQPQAPLQVRRLARLREMRRHAQRLGAPADALACLDAAIEHAQHRAALPRPFLARARAVRSHWRVGHYRAWSSGRMSLLHDLLIAS